MTIITKRLMTVSSRCSDLFAWVLLAVLMTVSPLRVSAQRNVWNMPQYMETVRASSFSIGTVHARDTYLSESTYDGASLGFEIDGWTGYEPYRLFSQGRTHSDIYFGLMDNPNGGGSTMEFSSRNYAGFMWHAFKNSKYDFLVGPAVMCELGLLYNQQNSNNPVNVEGYVGGGVCVDNTLRFREFGYDMGFQATLYVPLAGMGFAPDYDQPYYYMYKYGEYGKALHFISPFNNIAFTQQIALVLPIRDKRLRVGFTVDGIKNYLGGHSRFMANSMFTIGFGMRYQTKSWE